MIDDLASMVEQLSNEQSDMLDQEAECLGDNSFPVDPKQAQATLATLSRKVLEKEEQLKTLMDECLI